MNILISIDQLLNSLAGGDPDETISSRIGKLKQNEKEMPIVINALDWILENIDKNHCIEAIEIDEGSESIFVKFSKRK